MHRKSVTILSLCLMALTAAGLASCEKVITADLNKEPSQLVIEGTITNGSGPDEVRLSRSGNFFEPALTFPPVTDALVTVTDNAGHTDTLRETKDGTYRSSKLRGVPGRTYRLSVKADGKEYSGVSTMPEKVPIGRISAAPMRMPDGTMGYDLHVRFEDPPGAGNFYAVNLHSTVGGNGSLAPEPYILYSDRLTNGNEADIRIFAGRNNLLPGDTLSVELLSIDEATYNYYESLNDLLLSSQGLTTLSPANPNSNLSNNSLGYFGAFAIDTKVITMP